MTWKQFGAGAWTSRQVRPNVCPQWTWSGGFPPSVSPMQVKFELCTEAKTMSDEPWPAAYVVNCRYGNINGGYQKTKEIMNGVPVFHNECAFRCCRRLIGGAAPLPCLVCREDKKWMYFSGQHWTIDDDKNPNNATFYKSTDTANPDRDRPADVKWNGASSSSAESQPLRSAAAH